MMRTRPTTTTTSEQDWNNAWMEDDDICVIIIMGHRIICTGRKYYLNTIFYKTCTVYLWHRNVEMFSHTTTQGETETWPYTERRDQPSSLYTTTRRSSCSSSLPPPVVSHQVSQSIYAASVHGVSFVSHHQNAVESSWYSPCLRRKNGIGSSSSSSKCSQSRYSE